MCVKVLGDDKKLWEDEVYKFARKHQLEVGFKLVLNGNLILPPLLAFCAFCIIICLLCEGDIFFFGDIRSTVIVS